MLATIYASVLIFVYSYTRWVRIRRDVAPLLAWPTMMRGLALNGLQDEGWMPRREARTDGSQPCVVRRHSAVEGSMEYGRIEVDGPVEGLRMLVSAVSVVYWQHITVIAHVNVMPSHIMS